MMDWQPIETAPRDGTRVRLGHALSAEFDKPAHSFGSTYGAWDGKRWTLSSFFIVPGGRFGMMSSEPTHWMPLPPPPTV